MALFPQSGFLQTTNWLLIFGLLPSILLSYCLFYAIYNVYFHPLSALPGPRLWIAFPILRNISSIRGTYDIDIRKFHNHYGEVVRYGPNQVSFITATAWKDIYGHKHPQLPKALAVDPKQVRDILNAEGPDHSRFRKSLSHAFSEKSLRDQEPLVKAYADMLIEKLHGFATSGSSVDMVKWVRF
jgi:hypothetical protein